MDAITQQNISTLPAEDLIKRRLALPRKMGGGGRRLKTDMSPVCYVATIIKVFRSLKDVHDDILNKTIPGFNQPLYDKLTTNTEEEDLDGHSVTNFVDGRSQIGINFKSEYTRLQNIACVFACKHSVFNPFHMINSCTFL